LCGKNIGRFYRGLTQTKFCNKIIGKHMIHNFIKFIAVAGLLALAPSVQAQEWERHNNMRSGEGIWRIELRDLERFLSMSSGDDDGVSEVHWLRVALKGHDGQFQSVKESNPFLSINGGARSRDNSIDIRVGDTVLLERLDDDTTDTYDMWVHTQEIAGGDIDGPMLRFEIKVDTRELDCAGDRVCNRGAVGVVTYHVSIPVPTQRHNTCNAQNSYRITATEDANMVLEPLNAASGRGDDVNVRHSTSGGHIISFGARGENSGVELVMLSGRVCAAWTGG
jgi:hypothetical protein